MSPLDLIDEFIDLLRRRWRIIVRITLLFALAAVVFALKTPRVFETFEVIQIERPAVSADGAGEAASARQLQQIQQRLFTRDSVLEVADKFDLFADLPELSATERYSRMRAAVSVETVAAARQGFADDGTISVLMVSAKWSDAVVARDLAHEFASRTLALSSDDRLRRAQETLDFFRLQEEALIEEISAVEDRREAYRNENLLAIAGSIEATQDEIGKINTAVFEIDQQILELETERDQLGVANLTSEVAKMRAGLRVEAIATEVDALQLKREALVAKRVELEDTLAKVPEVERALSDFDRSLAQLQQELNVVSANRREAETTYALEARDQGGRLTVIEPATVPEFQTSRSRRMTVMLGLAAGLALGIGLAFLLDFLHPVIRSAGQMSRRVGLTPVVSIPAVGDADGDPGRRGKPPALGTV